MHSEKQLWPDSSELTLLGREAGEHKRAWGLVSGLTKALQRERMVKAPPSTPEQAQRIAHLEGKIVKQRHFLARLEECRAFERETEEILISALTYIAESNSAQRGAVVLQEQAKATLHFFETRKGPRPQETDAPT
jgi:hypothetical protein